MSAVKENSFGVVLKEGEPEVEMNAGGSVLDAIHRGPMVRPRRLFLYGVPGVGKSTAASQAPNSIFVPTEDGIGDLDVASFPVCRTLAGVQRALTAIQHEKHDFKTLVIDSLDWLEKLIDAHVADQKGVEAAADAPFGQGLAAISTTFQDMLPQLSAIRDRGLHIVFVAHAKADRIDCPTLGTYSKWLPFSKRCAPIAMQWCDEVFFANYDRIIDSNREGTKTVSRPISVQRIVKTQEQPACSAKCRLPNVPEQIELSWEAYAKYFPKS